MQETRTVWSAAHPDKSWRKSGCGWIVCPEIRRLQKEHAWFPNIRNRRRLHGSPHLQWCSSGTNCAMGMTWQNPNIASVSGAWALTPNGQHGVMLHRDAASLGSGSGGMRREWGCASKAHSGSIIFSCYPWRSLSWEGSLLCNDRMTDQCWMMNEPKC